MQIRSITILVTIFIFGIVGCDAGSNSNAAGNGGQADTMPPQGNVSIPDGDVLPVVSVLEGESPMPGLHGVLAEHGSNTKIYALRVTSEDINISIMSNSGLVDEDRKNDVLESTFYSFESDQVESMRILVKTPLSVEEVGECDFVAMECRGIGSNALLDGVEFKAIPSKFYMLILQQ